MSSRTRAAPVEQGSALIARTREVRESSATGRAALRERVAVVRTAREARADRTPGQAPAAQLCRIRLPADLRSAGAARRLVLGLVEVWKVRLDSDALAVLVSEVAGNAVRHAGTPFDLVVTLTRGEVGAGSTVRVEVVDADPTPIARGAVPSRTDHPDAEAENGRGLHLLDALSQAWGTAATGRGKSVWFDLAAERS